MNIFQGFFQTPNDKIFLNNGIVTTKGRIFLKKKNLFIKGAEKMKYLLIIFFLSTIQLAHSKDHKRKIVKRIVCRDVVLPQAKRMWTKCKSKPEKRRKKFCCNKAAGLRKGLHKLGLYNSKRKSGQKCKDFLEPIEKYIDLIQEECDK